MGRRGGRGLDVTPHCHESAVFQIWYSRHVEAESILSGIGNWLSTVNLLATSVDSWSHDIVTINLSYSSVG